MTGKVILMAAVLVFSACTRPGPPLFEDRIAQEPGCSEGVRVLDEIDAAKKNPSATVGDVVKLARGGLKEVDACGDPEGKIYLRAMLTTQLGQAVAVGNTREGTRLLRLANADLDRCAKGGSARFGKIFQARCSFQKGENETLISRFPPQRPTH